MTSNDPYQEAFVWIWLPGETDPVVAGRLSAEVDVGQLDELTYLLESGSERIGALDFQRSATAYEPRTALNVTLDELRSPPNGSRWACP